MNIWPSWKEQWPFAVALLTLLIALVVYTGVRVDLALKQREQIGAPEPVEHTIFFEGVGTATGKPDIATVSLSVQTEGETVESAQEENTSTANALIEQLKALAIHTNDIQTSSYNVYENTEWNSETETYESKGWIVSQQLTVKIRDTENIGDVLSMAGASGVTGVSGPSWTLDDPSKLKDLAREEALADAQKKVGAIASTLNLQIGEVVGYNEWAEEPSGPYPYRGYTLDALEVGGASPDIETGTSDIVMHVSITYTLIE
jgi:uncharacterized protein YggE